MNKKQIKKSTKAFFRLRGLEFPKDPEAQNELYDFAEFVIKRDTDEIKGFVSAAADAVLYEQNKPARKAKIGQVWKNKITGIKEVANLTLLMALKADPVLYEFICETPHRDNDYTYNCNYPYCECKKHEIFSHA